MARYPTREKEIALAAVRQKLLETAAQEFARHGFAAANINQISLSAGYAKGTIYNYFPSKHALMDALLEDIARIHADFIRHKVLTTDDPRERVRDFFKAGFDFVSQHLALAQVMITTLHSSEEEFKTRMFQAYQPLFSLLAEDILTPGVQAGIFGSVDVPSTATLLMTIYLGSAGQVSPEGKPWLDPGVVADFVLRSLEKRS